MASNQATYKQERQERQERIAELENDSYLRSGLRRLRAVGHGHPWVPRVPPPDEIEIIDFTSENEDMDGI